MRLVLERAESWQKPIYERSELERAAKETGTEERLSELLNRKVLISRQAEGYVCRECPEECVLDVDYSWKKGMAVVFCGQGVWEGPLEVDAAALQGYTLSEKSLRSCLRDDNGMEDLRDSVTGDIFAVGTLSRRGIEVQVFFARRLGRDFANTLRGVGSCTPGNKVLISPAFAIADPDVRNGLAAGRIHHLCLLDALPPAGFALQLSPIFNVIAPDYYASRAKAPDFIFEDLHLEFREEPGEQHIVLFNGRPHSGFQESDINFARLLRIAVHRKLDPKVYGGGWVKKKETGEALQEYWQLEALRDALDKAPPTGYSSEDMRILLKTSQRRKGEVTLAVDPRNIRFHPSIREFRPLHEEKVAVEHARAKKAKKAGQARAAGSRAAQAGKLEKGVENARVIVEEALALLPDSLLSA